MLLKIENNVIINTDQIVSITKSNTVQYPSVMTMSTGDTYLMKQEYEELGNKIAMAIAAADICYLPLTQ